MARSMAIATPLGEDVLLFHRMHAREELGRTSEFYLELLGDPATEINLDEILGSNVTVAVMLQDGSHRFFNGFVTRFAAGGRHGRYLRYTATVAPWPWFLTRTSDCRIFQDKTVREILEEVFADHPMANFEFALTETYEKWPYCVQYRETDFNFVSRLLEHEGIYYYYRHIDGAHTMVLTDSIDKHEPFPGYDQLRFIRPHELVRPDAEHLGSWEYSRTVQPGVFSLDDYDFERPSVDLRLARPTPRNYALSEYEWFDYPGFFTKKARGEHFAQVRGEEFGSQFERKIAVGNTRGASVGSVFTLDGFPRDDQNTKHLIVSLQLDLEYSDYEAMPEGSGGSSFRCRLEAVPSTQPFRPQRITPKPFVQGPQTAVVVGPSNEEIYTDVHGRVKVQFHWDSRGKNDEQSSCWIRVSQAWAGKGWGSLHTPRIGHEVIVDFLEGDPDQPIITGRVYNATNIPPYALPAKDTHSGIKSRSSRNGDGTNFNEMRMEDTKGSELFFMQAEKDWRIHVKNNETENVGASISTSAGGAISRSSGGSHSRTAGDSITDKAKNTYTLNTGKGQSLKAGGSYQLLTNEGIHLKTINFVMELIEAGIESAMASLKGDAKEAAGAAKDLYKGDSKAADALVGKVAGQMSTAFGSAIGAASGELTRICTEGEKGAAKSKAQAEAAGVAAANFVQAVQNDAGAEAVASAFLGMAVAAYEAYADARKLIDGLLPKIPSIVMWAMKDIQGQALWNVSFESKFRDVTLEAKARDIHIKGKKNVNVEATTKNLNLKASAKDVNMEAAKKDVNIKASAKDVKMTAKKKLMIKAEEDNLVMETGKNMTIKAAKKMQLKCGDASITLLEGGDILIRGKEIKIKTTSGPVTIKGTPIKLN